jgi:hypothetical protein
LATIKKFDWSRMESGVVLFLVGLTKKLLIADNLAEIADRVFADPTQFQTRDLWLAMFCYGGQIYCDFSGYTDMAIAIARMMGFDFSANFASPYLATSLSDFWRRWHISLSTWLRDYLYIPLGGSRFGKLLTARNLMLTMLLGGLWHGASWTFVIWGAIHGVALVIGQCLNPRPSQSGSPSPTRQRGSTPTRAQGHSRYHELRSVTNARATQLPNQQIDRSPNPPIPQPEFRIQHYLRRITGWAMTLLIVHIAWVFFRCQPITPPGALEPEPTTAALARATYFVTHLFVPANVADPVWLMNKLPMILLFALLAVLHLYEDWLANGRPRLRLPAPIAGIGYATWIVALVLFSPENTSPFIYFQF